MQKVKLMCVVVACCVLALVSVGHAGDGVDHKNKLIKVAGYDAVTGKYGNYGSGDKMGQEIALEQINNMGGIQAGPLKGYKLELDFYDDRGDAREAASVAKKIASGDYLTVMGPSMSSSALAANPVFFRYRIANVITYSNADSITAQGFDTIARLPFTTKSISDAIAKSISNEMGKKTVAVIYENQDYGQQLNNALLAVQDKYGIKVVSQDVITAGQDVDFKSVLTRAKSENPDVLVIFVTYNEGGLIVKQAREMGWELPIVGPESLTDPKFFELAGDAKNVHLVISDDIDSSTPQAQYLNAQWKKRMGEPVAPNAAVFGYDAVQVTRKIIENGATTREEFIKGIQGAEVKGGIYSSLYTFDDKGDSEKFSFVTVTANQYREKLK
jgi:branched-chain amino acid transport system substrate-binding protein